MRCLVMLAVGLAARAAHAQDADAGVPSPADVAAGADVDGGADAAPVQPGTVIEVGEPVPWEGPPPEPEPEPEPRAEMAVREEPEALEGLERRAPTTTEDGVVVRVGNDVTWAKGGEGAPFIGNLEFGATTEKLQLGYFTFRAEILGHHITKALNELGAGGDRGRTMACYLCFNLGFRVLRLTGGEGEPAGYLLAGLHLESTWVGDAFDFIVIGIGPEMGYMTRRGAWFLQAHVGVSQLRKGGESQGFAMRAEVDGFWRGLGPMALYWRLGYGQGQLDNGELNYSYGGPIVTVGIAWVSR